jgi:hypothetical protein
VEDVRALSRDCEDASTLREPGISMLSGCAERYRWCARDARPAERRCPALPWRIRRVATVVSQLLVIGTYVLYNIRCMCTTRSPTVDSTSTLPNAFSTR